jgi:hypothetical protein
MGSYGLRHFEVGLWIRFRSFYKSLELRWLQAAELYLLPNCTFCCTRF